MHGHCAMGGYISYRVGSLICFNNQLINHADSMFIHHPYLKFMATLTLLRAAVTCSRGPKGMKAWQLLLDWLTLAERARLIRAAVGLCREVEFSGSGR